MVVSNVDLHSKTVQIFQKPEDLQLLIRHALTKKIL